MSWFKKKDETGVNPAAVTEFIHSCAADGGEGDVDLEQFEQFFGSLGVDLATIDPYIFFWKMGVKGCWCATKEELVEGFRQQGVQIGTAPKGASGYVSQNTNTLIAKWKKEITSELSTFREFHVFVFNFIRASPSAKVVHLELEEDTTGEDTLRMVLQLMPGIPSFPVDTFIDYLKQLKKPLNQDQWKQMVRFLTTMNTKCDGYDDAFFPALFDGLAERCAKAE